MAYCRNKYITPDILKQIDRDNLRIDISYQLEIGALVGMDNLSKLVQYLDEESENEEL